MAKMSPDSPMNCGFNEYAIDMAIPILYFLIFILALIMNGVAVRVCMRLHSTTTFIVYLKNLVAADLLMTLTIPLKAANDMPNAPLALKTFSCRYSDVIFYLCMYMSILLLALISLDRFFKIVKPCGRLLAQKLVFGKVMSAFFWVGLLGLEVIPTIVLTNQDPTNNTNGSCIKMKSDTGLLFHSNLIIFNVTLFWLLCVLICSCYICIARKVLQSYRKSGSRNNTGMHKTKVRVFLVLAVFLVCFVPYHALRIPYTLLQVKIESTCTKSTLRIAKKITLWISSINVCLDPLIYFFLCKSFRTSLFQTFHLPSGTCSWLTRKAPGPNTVRATSKDDSS
ncbi:P2Y purinoceptor 13 [Esox lucius]|uniref:P2Y purinoceptor 13 n=1 Tax=Esox lucius TaxID=8010 RepID=UPI001476B737|nr:P2Y purinoceptor 13 [Esox lucius]